MRLIVFAAFLVVVLILVLAAYMVARAVNHYTGRKERWHVVRDELDTATEFWVVKGQNADFVGRARRSEDDYSDKLIDLQTEADGKCDDRNIATRVIEK